MEIKILNKKILEENLEQLLDMEKYLSDDISELWNEENFLLDIEGKFDLSKIAFDDEEIIGYIISSIKREKGLIFGYVNRTFIHPKYRDTPVYLVLTLNTLREFSRRDIKVLRWKCSPDNKRVYEHHLSFADEIIGEEIIGKNKYHLFQKRIK